MTLNELSAAPALLCYALVLSFVIGTVFGSFLNCRAWRFVHGESILKGRSHCAVCGHVLGARDLVPVVSYLVLHGKCRYCGEKISPRYMITELIAGSGFLACVLRFGLTWETLRAVVLICFLLILSLVDIDSQIIPDRYLIASFVLWLVTLPFVANEADPAFGWLPVHTLLSGLLGGVVIGGVMLVVSLLFERVTGKESMGGGDIKLYFIAGLYLGIWNGLLCILLSCIIGLLVVVVTRSKRIPFGPSLSAALLFCLFFGERLVSAYISLL